MKKFNKKQKQISIAGLSIIAVAFLFYYFAIYPQTKAYSIPQPIGFTCDQTVDKQVPFTSTTNSMQIGNSCSSTSVIQLFSCSDSSCSNVQKFGEQVKLNGVNPSFNGLGTGNLYAYYCYDCVSSGGGAKLPCSWSSCPSQTECNILQTDFYSQNPKYDCTAFDITDCIRLSSSCNICTEQWQCSSWDTCTSNSQHRLCQDQKNCGTTNSKPQETQTCISGAVCGNSICETGETPTSCPSDCKVTPPVCTQETGQLCNPATKQTQTYTDGCIKSNLLNSGYLTNLDLCKTTPPTTSFWDKIKEWFSNQTNQIITAVFVVILGIGGVFYFTGKERKGK